MRPLTDFHSRILPSLPGCPDPTLNQALVDTAILFCERTLVLRERLTKFNTVAGVADYTLDAPSAHEDVARIIHVVVGNRMMALVPQERAMFDARSGTPTQTYTLRNESEFLMMLHPTPDQVLTIEALVALRPKRSATQLNDDLYELWMDAIAAGTISKLAAIPGQPFTNEPLSAAMHSRFYGAMSTARAEGSMGRVRGQITATMRRFV